VDFVQSLPGETLPCPLVNAGGRLYFTLAHLEFNLGFTELWHTDGTTPGTGPALQEAQRRENAFLPMGSFRGHLVLGANDAATPNGIEPMLVNFGPVVPYPPVFTGARRGQPFSFTYADMLVEPVVDIEGDALSPLRLKIWSGTLTRNGSAVSESTEIAPGDRFVWQPPVPAESGLVYPFELYVSDPWKEGRATVGIHIDAPVDVWTQGHFTGEEFFNEEISGRMADPDGDGVANALEFVFGRHPRTHNPEPACTPSVADAPVGGGRVVRFTFVRTAALAEGTVLNVESSPDLTPASWETVATKNQNAAWTGSATVTETTLPDERVEVVVEIPAPPGEGQAFMRLSVGL
jgi:hypothetical protein